MLRKIVIVVAGLLVAIIAALAGMLAFGTSEAPQLLASLGAPFRNVDYSDLPAGQKIPASHGTPIAFRVWETKSQFADAA